VRSSQAHAWIGRIDIVAALPTAGVIVVLTGEDALPTI
jgi:xanthine dehydrogenase molybdopterin-binding subunit B